MEEKRFVFSGVIADFIDEIRRDFEESKPDNPLQWLEGALQRHCKVSEENAKRIAKELIEGILLYKTLKISENPLEEIKDKLTEEEIKALENERKLIKQKILED